MEIYLSKIYWFKAAKNRGYRVQDSKKTQASEI